MRLQEQRLPEVMSPTAQGRPRAPGWTLQLFIPSPTPCSQGRLRAGPSLQQMWFEVMAKVMAKFWLVRCLLRLGGGAGIAGLRFLFKAE